MELKEIGEFGFINQIAARVFKYDTQDIRGIGDDCAVITEKSGLYQIVTTDMLIENTHFLLDKISAGDLGYKSLAVNLSDIAAMGGTPHSAFISLGIPQKISVEWLREFYEGMQELAAETGTLVLGGDTTRSSGNLVINIAVIGHVKSAEIKYRSTAKEGDYVCVTDFLGDSAGGLNLLLSNEQGAEELLRAHNRPRPHLKEGLWLAGYKSVHAMLDVSDGVDSDLKRIMEQSQVGAEINLESIPVSRNLIMTGLRLGWNITNLAIAGGEDYCLLCTVAAEEYTELNRAFRKEFGHDLYQIGVITKSNDLVYKKHDKIIVPDKKGYDHFKGSKQ